MSDRYFALYVDHVMFDRPVTEVPDPRVWGRRWQWIVLPKLHSWSTEHHRVFSRHQNRMDHRAVWKSQLVQNLNVTYHSIVTGTEDPRMLLHPPIVVEIGLEHLETYVRKDMTPWSVINTVKRHAPSYGYLV